MKGANLNEKNSEAETKKPKINNRLRRKDEVKKKKAIIHRGQKTRRSFIMRHKWKSEWLEWTMKTRVILYKYYCIT